MRGNGRVFKRGNKWWIAYCVRGEEKRESGGNTQAEAKRFLKERLGQIYSGTYLGPQEERLTVNDLLDNLITRLELKGAKSIPAFVSGLKPIREFFGFDRAVDVTPERIRLYIKERKNLGKANATINRGVTGLRQAFNLARKEGKLNHLPYFTVLPEDNARQGFFEQHEFEAVLESLPDYLRGIAQFAYMSGWRKAEIVSLHWNQVDRISGEVRLKTSKNGRGRVLPIEGELQELIEQRWVAREVVLKNGDTFVSPFVFHREGEEIQRFDKAWKTACKKAGYPGKLFHDFRRTASRNMIRAGVPQSVAREITGHKTYHTFDRYNITSEEDKRQALLATQKYVAGELSEKKIVALRGSNI